MTLNEFTKLLREVVDLNEDDEIISEASKWVVSEVGANNFCIKDAEGKYYIVSVKLGR